MALLYIKYYELFYCILYIKYYVYSVYIIMYILYITYYEVFYSILYIKYYEDKILCSKNVLTNDSSTVISLQP